MGEIVHRLEWDSEFFGFPIARVDLQGIDAGRLAAIETEARDMGILCAYGSLDPAETAAILAVQQAGYRFVEAPTTLSLHHRVPVITPSPGIMVRLGSVHDLAALSDAMELLAPWSRFAVDPHFGIEAARRMQHAWIERAARCDTGERQLVVAESEGEIVAFITRCTTPEPIIDTIGTVARGAGAARSLVQASRSWAGDVPLLGGPIAARNIAGLRFVGQCGYLVSKVRYIYHRWLDEDSVIQR